MDAMRIECLKQIRDSFLHLRDKAIFLSKLSSGLDDTDLFELKISDFEVNEFDICYLEGTRVKTEVLYQTFFNSEAVSMIELYIKERKKELEKHNLELKNDDWLFANIRANIEYDKERNEISREYDKCKTSAFSEALKLVCRKLDIKNITPKSLR